MTHKHIQTKANTDKLCETMQNQHYSPIKKKQHNLPAPWVLSSAGKLQCFVPSIFSSFFIFLFSLSIVDLLISVLCTLFLLSLQDTPPYCWLAASVFWDMVRHCGQKCFSKIAYCTFECQQNGKTNFLKFLCSNFWSGNLWKLGHFYLCILNVMFAYLNTPFQKTRNATKLS